MEWVDQLQGQVVGLDTAPIIYFVEENPKYVAAVEAFFGALASGEFQAVTSVVSLLEVMVHPYRRGDEALARHYRDILLNTDSITVVPLTPEIAENAAMLRARHNLGTPDAIQVATAVSAGATTLLTNDSNLANLPHLQVLVLDKLLEQSV